MSTRGHPWPGLHRRLIAAGATWRYTKHAFLYRVPAGGTVAIARTPSDRRAYRQAVADLRRAGVSV